MHIRPQQPANQQAIHSLNSAAVVVLGHPEYNPCFSLEPSGRSGIGCEDDVPTDVFMTLELRPGSLLDVSGQATYHAACCHL